MFSVLPAPYSIKTVIVSRFLINIRLSQMPPETSLSGYRELVIEDPADAFSRPHKQRQLSTRVAAPKVAPSLDFTLSQTSNAMTQRGASQICHDTAVEQQALILHAMEGNAEPFTVAAVDTRSVALPHSGTRPSPKALPEQQPFLGHED